MKKALIAGAASVALAAMPVVGAFAATSSSFTDSLTVDVKGGCTLTNSTKDTTPGTYNGDRSFTGEAQPGNVIYLNASGTDGATPGTGEGTIAIGCNTSDSTKSWVVAVSVEGLTIEGTETTIGGGANKSGDTSGWAIKSNASLSTGSFAADPFSEYAAAANTAEFLKATADKTGTFNPSYQVYVKPGQTPGVYKGKAIYSITLPSA